MIMNPTRLLAPPPTRGAAAAGLLLRRWRRRPPLQKSRRLSALAAVEAEEEEGGGGGGAPPPPTPTRTTRRSGGSGGGGSRPRLEELRRKLKEEEGGPLNGFSKARSNAVVRDNSPSSSSSSPASPASKDDARTTFQEILRVARSELLSSTTAIPTPQAMLTDSYSRRHTYLRISLSEKCNLRCRYCMPPEGVPLSPNEELLSSEEVVRLAELFARGGVDKVRLTGGEPLLRPDLPDLISSIRSISGIKSVGITTNGLTLSRRLPSLLDAGLTHVNVSLDTLRADRFEDITRRKGLGKVLTAIDDAASAFEGEGERGRVKINNVVMRGFNDDELRDFALLTLDKDVDVRFIEWMPFLDNGWNRDRFVSYADMMARVTGRREDGTEMGEGEECRASLNGVGPLPLRRLADGPNDTTKWWSVAAPSGSGTGTSPSGRLGFITSMSSHFCSTCNRLRITADGQLKACLFGGTEVSLRDALRGGATEEELRTVIAAAVRRKKFALGGHGDAEGIARAGDNRPMTLIGG